MLMPILHNVLLSFFHKTQIYKKKRTLFECISLHIACEVFQKLALKIRLFGCPEIRTVLKLKGGGVGGGGEEGG